MKNNLSHLYPKFPFELPLILDGSCGTRLMESGMPTGICAENWICEHMDIMANIQSGYVKNGSDALYTPTFGANSATLKRYGCAEKIKYINEALASLTKTSGAKYIGGDVSPTGKMLYPAGVDTFDEIAEIYAEQASYLEKSVDFFISETNISLAEARAAVFGIRSVSDKPIFVTFTVNENGKTLFGDDILACLLSLADMGISAFGINCSFGAEKMLDVIKPIVPYSLQLGIPLIAKPNAMSTGEKTSPETFGKIAEKFLECGVYILGGCCGTNEKYIREIKAAASAFSCAAPPIYPKSTDTLICSQKQIFDTKALDFDSLLYTPLDDDFADAIEDAEYIALKIRSEGDFDAFYENLPFISAPLIISGEKMLCERIRKIFAGKILFL